MSKKNKTPLGIFAESIGLYFSNFDKFFKYMSFPVLGQLIGLSLVFLLSYFYAKNMVDLVEKIPILNKFPLLLTVAVLIILPGMAIFIKSFWEYLVAYGAINSMLKNMLKSGKVYDFDAHTELIKRRTLPFVGIWALFGVFSLFAMIPLISWIPTVVIAVFFVLVFQVFTYEPEQSPLGCLKRSFQLVKGHFVSTLLLMSLVGALTYFLIPQLASLFFEYTNLAVFFSKTFILPFLKELPINEWNAILSYYHLPILELSKLSNFVFNVFIAQIFIQYTLPLRSILWGMWYKELNGGKLELSEPTAKARKKGSKKPSEKLMEASKKKYSTKKLDRNLLRRAMEKDEE